MAATQKQVPPWSASDMAYALRGSGVETDGMTDAEIEQAFSALGRSETQQEARADESDPEAARDMYTRCILLFGRSMAWASCQLHSLSAPPDVRALDPGTFTIGPTEARWRETLDRLSLRELRHLFYELPS